MAEGVRGGAVVGGGQVLVSKIFVHTIFFVLPKFRLPLSSRERLFFCFWRMFLPFDNSNCSVYLFCYTIRCFPLGRILLTS